MKREGIILLIMFIMSMGCVIFYFLTQNTLCGFIGYLFMLLIQIFRLIDINRKKKKTINTPEDDSSPNQ